MKKHNQNATGPATSMVKVDVCGTPIEACREGDTVWISVRRTCEVLGVQAHGQAARLKSKPWATTQVICAVAEDGKAREILCISHKSFPMWLATIEPSRSTAKNLRERLATFQKEAADVLYRHFFGNSVSVAAQPVIDLDAVRGAIRSEMSAEMSSVHTRLATLESRSAIIVSNTGPVIGGGAAELRILAPLREAARIRVRAVHNEAAFSSQRAKLENALRSTLGFHRSGGRAWALFPTAKLGEATDAVTVILRDAKDLAGASVKKPVQLSLVGNTNGKRTAS